jgi:Cysteine rich repeat
MRVLLIVLAVLAAASLTAMAPAKVKLRQACGVDLDRFCQDVKKGEGRKACLRTHLKELQPQCAELLKQRDADKAKR